MYKPTNLLSTRNAKTIKGEKQGFTTYIMYLSPYTDNSKGINLCSHASEGCAKVCLFNSGAARFQHVQNGKRNKTEFYLNNRNEFLLQLVNEIEKIVSLHQAIVGTEQIGRSGKVVRYKDFAIRLNGTSDIPFEKMKIKDNKNIFELFPNVQFYDYTKNYLRFERVKNLSNYHLTFSRSEINEKQSNELLNKGFNVAMVFDKFLPNTYNGFEVINGDETDLRFLDKKNVIVGLLYKKATGTGGKAINQIVKEYDFVIKNHSINEVKKVA